MKKSSYFHKLSYETIKFITKLQLYMKTQLGAKQAFRYAVLQVLPEAIGAHPANCHIGPTYGHTYMDGKLAPKYVYRKALLLSKGTAS